MASRRYAQDGHVKQSNRSPIRNQRKCVGQFQRNWLRSRQTAFWRPEKISEREKNTVYRLAKQDPNKSISAIAAELNETLHEASVTRNYVSKLLRDKELNSYYAARKPLLNMHLDISMRPYFFTLFFVVFILFFSLYLFSIKKKINYSLFIEIIG
jgi:hypothetical protein